MNYPTIEELEKRKAIVEADQSKLLLEIKSLNHQLMQIESELKAIHSMITMHNSAKYYHTKIGQILVNGKEI